MLGLLVSEFVNMVEARFGAPVADAILFGTDVTVDDVGITLGEYPSSHLDVLFEALSRRTGLSPHELLSGYAAGLMRRIRVANPDVFSRHADLFIRIDTRHDAPMRTFDIDERDAEEIEALLGARVDAQRLVAGLEADLDRYERGRAARRRHVVQPALQRVRPGLFD
jgi:hypothetical protein